MKPQYASPVLSRILGEDPGLKQILAQAVRVAPTRLPVLVTGESGTGKELLARLIHDHGSSPQGPFVAVNCGTLPRELADSELFGHERGAFTGAGARRAGWFEEADGGTLVLDEIGELPLDVQPKLLRVLETGRVRRVGGAGEIAVQVRIIAMTLRHLRREVERGRFRIDLFHRLAGFELELPPLRHRRDDIPTLANHFLKELEAEAGPRELDDEATDWLVRHDWPGNVRELRNVIRRAALLSSKRIRAIDLGLTGGPLAAGDGARRAREAWAPPTPVREGVGGPSERATSVQRSSVPRLADADNTAGVIQVGDTLTLPGRTYDEIERAVLAWALRRHGGSRRRAARALAIARSTFCDKVKRYGLAS